MLANDNDVMTMAAAENGQIWANDDNSQRVEVITHFIWK
jgi:hypothetical protein